MGSGLPTHYPLKIQMLRSMHRDKIKQEKCKVVRRSLLKSLSVCKKDYRVNILYEDKEEIRSHDVRYLRLLACWNREFDLQRGHEYPSVPLRCLVIVNVFRLAHLLMN